MKKQQLVLVLWLCLFLAGCKDKTKEPQAVPQQIEMTTAQPEQIEAGAEITAEGNFVDLQSVSIDPIKPTISKGTQTTVISNIKNNGPDVIQVGEAKIQITVNGRYLYKPSGFKSDRWKLDTITGSTGSSYQIFITNSKAMGVNEPGWPGFRFIVKSKAPGTADITLASTLSATSQSSETDGQNNSVRTEIIVTK